MLITTLICGVELLHGEGKDREKTHLCIHTLVSMVLGKGFEATLWFTFWVVHFHSKLDHTIFNVKPGLNELLVRSCLCPCNSVCTVNLECVYLSVLLLPITTRGMHSTNHVNSMQVSHSVLYFRGCGLIWGWWKDAEIMRGWGNVRGWLFYAKP